MVCFQICGYLYIYLLESLKISKLFNMQLVDSFLSQRSLGILVHPSSIPGGSYCGTFGEGLKKWINLLSINKIRYWQFLPLTPADQTGSPYSSPSSFAINPWFLDVNELINSGFISENQEISKISLEGAKYEFFDFKIADSLSVLIENNILDHWNNQSEIIRNNFYNWCKINPWVEDYAVFMVLKEEFDNKGWWEWPKVFRLKEEESIRNFINSRVKEILVKKLFQWHLNRQWINIRKYASEKEIKLIGDLPFYVSKDSVDVWSNKSLFSVSNEGNLIFQSGVPPDYFSSTGQLWGTPVYYWAKHQRTKYDWWVKRFKRQFELVDILRVDHFRAFAGYWRVDGEANNAINGSWIKSPGKELLKTITKSFKVTKLPIIAEDLGVITEDVITLRNSFALPGMKILQFAFDGNNDNPYLPKNIQGKNWVVYTGTHDNSTAISWWQDLDQHKRIEIDQTYGSSHIPPWNIIEIGMKTNANLFIVPIQDILSLDNSSRLNTPGTIENNWKWKIRELNESLIYSLKKYGKLGREYSRIN